MPCKDNSLKLGQPRRVLREHPGQGKACKRMLFRAGERSIVDELQGEGEGAREKRPSRQVGGNISAQQGVSLSGRS